MSKMKGFIKLQAKEAGIQVTTQLYSVGPIDKMQLLNALVDALELDDFDIQFYLFMRGQNAFTTEKEELHEG